MSIINLVKQSLRISQGTTDFDAEISELISQAVEDLQSSGAKEIVNLSSDSSFYVFSTTEITDANIRQLILLYCKAMFGLENPDKQWFMERYYKKKAEFLNQSKYVGGNNV